MTLAFKSIWRGWVAGGSGDRQDRHRRADEQAGDEDGTGERNGDMLETGDGHDENSLFVWWPDHPALMLSENAEAVPVLISLRNAGFSAVAVGCAHVKNSAYWQKFLLVRNFCGACA
tara:strand:- start:5625 stop:5975 length:351 start_codon:yes stop_codon:yes gene_type:complete